MKNTYNGNVPPSRKAQKHAKAQDLIVRILNISEDVDSPGAKPQKASTLVDDFVAKRLMVNRDYQRAFHMDKHGQKWSSQLIVSLLNNGTEYWDKIYLANRKRSNQTKRTEIVDGQHRIMAMTWFFRGLEYPVGDDRHGTAERYFLRLTPDETNVDCKRCLVQVGKRTYDFTYLTWPEIEDKLMGDINTLCDFETIERLWTETTFDIVTYPASYSDMKIYQIYRTLNRGRNTMSDQEIRNSSPGDAFLAIKLLTMKDIGLDSNIYEHHPLFDMFGSSLKWMALPTKEAEIQHFFCGISYLIKHWREHDFNLSAENLDAMGDEYNEDESFKSTYKQVREFCDFLYNAATVNGELTQPTRDHKVLFHSNRKIGLSGGKRLLYWVALMWDYIRKLTRVENGSTYRYHICNDWAFYNWLVFKVYLDLCTPRKGEVVIGKDQITEFRDAMGKGTMNKSEWIEPLISGFTRDGVFVKPYPQRWFDILSKSNQSELKEIGLELRDVADTFSKNQKLTAFQLSPPVGTAGEIIPMENLHGDHVVPKSRGGATIQDNLDLLTKKNNLEKSNHTV
jgi:hypothetical protein